MFALLSPRLWLAVVIAGLLAASHFGAYRSGKATVRAEWDKERAERTEQALAASETNRLRERVMAQDFSKVDHELQAAKTRRTVDSKFVADQLRELQAINDRLAATDPARSPGRTDDADPRSTVVRECTDALAAMDKAYGELVDKARALQALSSIVRVKP